MAGHLPLSRHNEPKLFELIDKMKNGIANALLLKKEFIRVDTYGYQLMKLSKDYVDNPSDLPFTFGRVTLSEASVGKENMWLAKDVYVEVHLTWTKTGIEIKNIFWVA